MSLGIYDGQILENKRKLTPGNTKMHVLIDALMKFVSVKEYDAFVERMGGSSELNIV